MSILKKLINALRGHRYYSWYIFELILSTGKKLYEHRSYTECFHPATDLDDARVGVIHKYNSHPYLPNIARIKVHSYKEGYGPKEEFKSEFKQSKTKSIQLNERYKNSYIQV